MMSGRPLAARARPRPRDAHGRALTMGAGGAHSKNDFLGSVSFSPMQLVRPVPDRYLAVIWPNYDRYPSVI
jgi:hypothetical protein